MIPVRNLIDILRLASAWEDGESLSAIRARLTPAQLTEPGKVILRIQERLPFPSMLCVRVEQHNELLFEVKQRLPQRVTHQQIDQLVQLWTASGWVEKVVQVRQRRV